jgi:hypothetical protein
MNTLGCSEVWRSPEEETLWKHDVETVRARPEEKKGHERIGLLVRVTPGRLGTDLSNAQNPEALANQDTLGCLDEQKNKRG